MATQGEQWEALCDEYRAAQAEDNRCFGKVNGAFAAVAAGKVANPSEADMAAWDAARAHLADVRKRMDEFVARNG